MRSFRRVYLPFVTIYCKRSLVLVIDWKTICLDSDNVDRIRRVRSFLGGGVHFKLERTSCQQSLKYISVYIIRKVHPFLLKKETGFCVIKIRNIILTIIHWYNSNKSEAAKIGSSGEGSSTLGGSGGMLPRKFWSLTSLKCTFCVFSERFNETMNRKLLWKLHVFSSKLIFVSVQ